MDDRQRHGQPKERKGKQRPNTTATQPNKEIFQSVVRCSLPKKRQQRQGYCRLKSTLYLTYESHKSLIDSVRPSLLEIFQTEYVR